MRFITFEKWKKEFPEMTGQWRTCRTCKGEGSHWDEFYEAWKFCRTCQGEGSISLDKTFYDQCVRDDKSKMNDWIEGKAKQAKDGFQKVYVRDIEWSNLMVSNV